jgi:tetratricopeptide (TPR) repeat protein
MRGVASSLLVLLLAAPGLAAGPEDPKGSRALGWLEVFPAVPSAALPAVRVTREELAARGLELLDQAEVFARLREDDRGRGLEVEAGRLLAEGRQLHLGLKLDEAAERYRQAVEVLERGFARFHAPGQLAEPLLQLGVAEFQAGRKESAERAFMRVIALAPELTLAEGYYSPSVRAAFQAARERLGPLEPGIPMPEELDRMCRATGLAGILAADGERVGDRPVARLALFDGRRRRFVALESAVIQEGQWQAVGRQLAQRLWPRAAALAGLPLEPPDAGPVSDGEDALEDRPAQDGGLGAESALDAGEDLRIAPLDAGLGGLEDEPPPEPWYTRHWWIWPVAAVVVGAAIALPLTLLREDVVDVRIRTH